MSADGVVILVVLVLVSMYLLAHWRRVLATLAAGAIAFSLFGALDLAVRLRG